MFAASLLDGIEAGCRAGGDVHAITLGHPRLLGGYFTAGARTERGGFYYTLHTVMHCEPSGSFRSSGECVSISSMKAGKQNTAPMSLMSGRNGAEAGVSWGHGAKLE